MRKGLTVAREGYELITENYFVGLEREGWAEGRVDGREVSMWSDSLAFGLRQQGSCLRCGRDTNVSL